MAGFLDSIVGGKATLAETDVESYTTLLPFAPGWLVAGGVAVLLISIAAALPKFLLKE